MFEPRSPSPAQLQLLRVLQDATRSSTLDFKQGPVFQYLLHEMGRGGVLDVEGLLRSLAPDFLVFKPPIAADMAVLSTVRGWYTADPGASEVHAGMIPAVRRCYDLFLQYRPPSPTEARPLRLAPQDLWPEEGIPSEAELFVVGLLLKVEGVGKVTLTDDPSSPWRIEVDAGIRRFARVGDYDSLLAALA
jgi:hypothetical protein